MMMAIDEGSCTYKTGRNKEEKKKSLEKDVNPIDDGEGGNTRTVQHKITQVKAEKDQEGKVIHEDLFPPQEVKKLTV